MRKILVSLLALSAVGTAQSADLDYDYLRGADYDPPPVAVIDWSGFYIGGHGGWTSGSVTKRAEAQAARVELRQRDAFGRRLQPQQLDDLRVIAVRTTASAPMPASMLIR